MSEPKLPSLSDAISRLFDQLVRDPWSRPPPTAASPGATASMDLQMPMAGGGLGDVSIAIEERRLVVRAWVRRAAADRAERVERVFALPPGVEIAGIEARFEADTLHVRVVMRAEGEGR